MHLNKRHLLRNFLIFIFLCATLFFIYFLVKSASQPMIRIGSKRFTESYILGEVLKQLAQQTDEAPVDYRPGLGNTGIVYAALQEGLIDVYPEYTGTIIYEILKKPELAKQSTAALNEALAHEGMRVSESLGFNDTYALAMLDTQAETLNIRTVSDLERHPELKLGFSPEFLGRPDGWEGLKKSNYILPQTQLISLDHSLGYEALAEGAIDIIDTYTTDPKIAKFKLRILEDDLHFFPNYEAVLLYRLKAAENFPKTWQNFQGLNDQLNNKTISHLNAEAELRGKNFTDIAHQYLSGSQLYEEFSAPESFWQHLFGPDFWILTRQHLLLVFGALIPAILVGVPLGIMAAHWFYTRHIILNAVSLIQTIPALALLAFLIPLFKEIGTLPALVALFLYALLPIVRNTYTGLTTISPSLQESAGSLGLPLWPRLYLIELPLASRTILAGIKTAAVISVGMATIAAFIGAGGYGERIVAGLALNDYKTLLAGAIPACVLALVVQFGFDLVENYFIPKSI